MHHRPHRQHFAQLLRRALFAVGLAPCALSCGSAAHTTVPEADELDADTTVNSGVNVCPYFQDSRILPQRIAPEQSASIVVRATDPDAADSLLQFAWSAASGVFSPSDKPVTNYTCSKLGPEQLTVTAKDLQGCSSELTIAVECIAQ